MMAAATADDPMVFGHALRDRFQLAPGFVQMNHGSYGATPKAVEEACRAHRSAMEAQPELWFRRDVFAHLDATRIKMAEYINANDPDDLVFVDNASDGVNAVLRSWERGAGGRLLKLNIAYGTTHNCAGLLAGEHFDAVTLDVPLPMSNAQIVALVDDFLNNKEHSVTIAEFSHITSSPAVLLPVRELVAVCRRRGIKTLIDGAHALGQVPIDVQELGCDYYIANAHKWLYSTKGAGILWASKTSQDGLFPNVIGSRANHTRSFQERWRYKGLFDYVPWLSMKDALEFRASCGGDAAIMSYLHTLSVRGSSLLADRWKTGKLVEDEQTGAIANVRLPFINENGAGLERLRAHIAKSLLLRFNMFAPIFSWNGALYARVSAAIYNELEDYSALADAIEQILTDAEGFDATSLEEGDDRGGIHF